MADNSLNARSKLISEVDELKKIQQSLIQTISICRRRIKIEKEFQKKRSEYLNMIVKLINQTQASSVALNEDTLKKVISDEPGFGRLLISECLDKTESQKLINELEAKILRYSSVQFEATAKFFFDELSNEKCLSKTSGSETLDENSLLDLQSEQEENSQHEMDRSPELWAKEWYEKFKRFTVVDEHGVLLPGGARKKTDETTLTAGSTSRNRYVLDTQPENQSDFSSRNRYILDTQAENRSQRAIREDVTLFTVSPATGPRLSDFNTEEATEAEVAERMSDALYVQF